MFASDSTQSFIEVDAAGFRTVRPNYLNPEQLQNLLTPLGFSLLHPGALREAILWLSDFYLAEKVQTTPWSDLRTQAAYLAYYNPLNICRLQAVLWEGSRLGFFNGLTEWFDFGAGPAPSAFAAKMLPQYPETLTLFEPAPQARNLIESFQKFGALRQTGIVTLNTSPQLRQDQSARQLIILSYVLNESADILNTALASQPEALLILEPSTHAAWPNMCAARKTLIQHGYAIWAPCTHQQDCPLRPEARAHKDWCHDRLHTSLPEWFKDLKLPIPLNTVTWSYLLARKSPSPHSGLGRLIGDALIEKGKIRQLFCQDNSDFYLRWRPRKRLKYPLSRGALVPHCPNPEQVRELDVGDELNTAWTKDANVAKD